MAAESLGTIAFSNSKLHYLFTRGTKGSWVCGLAIPLSYQPLILHCCTHYNDGVPQQQFLERCWNLQAVNWRQVTFHLSLFQLQTASNIQKQHRQRHVAGEGREVLLNLQVILEVYIHRKRHVIHLLYLHTTPLRRKISLQLPYIYCSMPSCQ